MSINVTVRWRHYSQKTQKMLLFRSLAKHGKFLNGNRLPHQALRLHSTVAAPPTHNLAQWAANQERPWHGQSLTRAAATNGQVPQKLKYELRTPTKG